MAAHPSIERAIMALRADDRETARAVLDELIKSEPQLSDGWLWMAAASDDVAQKRAFLQRALTINPSDRRARAGLCALEQQATPPPTAAVENTPSVARPSELIEQRTIAIPQSPLISGALAQPRFVPTTTQAPRPFSWRVLALFSAVIGSR